MRAYTTAPGKRTGKLRPDRGIASLRHETPDQGDEAGASRRPAPKLGGV